MAKQPKIFSWPYLPLIVIGALSLPGSALSAVDSITTFSGKDKNKKNSTPAPAPDPNQNQCVSIGPAPVMDPALLFAVPCDVGSFKRKETAWLNASGDQDGIKVVNRVKRLLKNIRVGLAAFALSGRSTGERLKTQHHEGSGGQGLDMTVSFVNQTLCCDGAVTEKKGHKLAVSLNAGFEQRVFYGIPYVGELGVRARESIGYNQTHMVGLECAGYCQGNRASLGVSGEVYANALSGLGDISGGVKGLSSAGIKACPQNPVFEIKIELARLMVFAQISAAWGLFSHTWEGDIMPETFPWVVYQHRED